MKVCRAFARPLLLLIVCLSFKSFGADALDNWQWRNPKTGTTISAATYGAGRFVLAGELGAVLVSEDGSNWSTYNTGATNSARGLVYGGGRFLLVGDSGLIASSSDGAAWTSVSGTTNDLRGVAYGNGVFVAVGSGGKVVTSTNGQNWVTQNFGNPVLLGGIAYGNGRFVATYEAWGVADVFAYVSTNGIDWTQNDVAGAQGINSIVFGKGIFVAGGGRIANFSPSPFFYTSTNGITWTERPFVAVSPRYSQVITVGEHFVGQVRSAVDEYTWLDGDINVSADGTNWTNTLSASENVRAGAYGDGRYVLVGVDNSLITSTDATNWTVTPAVSVLTDIAYGNGVYVAAGSGALVSTNGRSFEALPGVPVVSRVAFANGAFVAVGTNGLVLRSTDGRSWTRRNANTLQHLNGIAVGGGTLVAVGNSGTIITSPDGLVWTLRFNIPTGSHLYGITWANNRFVAVGSLGTIITSSNGIDWNVEYADTLNALFHATYGNGLYVAVGELGTILTSVDAGTWTPRAAGISALDLHSVTYGNGNFLITGAGAPNERSNVLLTSSNGVDWIRRNPGTREGLYGAAFMNGSFWIVGAAGAILESVQVSPMTLFARRTLGGVELTCSGGESGRVYELQTCTNAFGDHWLQLYRFTNGQAEYRFVDEVQQRPRSFYRLMRE